MNSPSNINNSTLLNVSNFFFIEIYQVPYALFIDVQRIIRSLIDWPTEEIFKKNDCDAFGMGFSDCTGGFNINWDWKRARDLETRDFAAFAELRTKSLSKYRRLAEPLIKQYVDFIVTKEKNHRYHLQRLTESH